MANELDLNTMYSILKGIFNREQNENYTNRNRSNFAGGLADLRNGWAAMQNARKNKQDQAEYKNSMGNGGGNQYPNGSIGATGDGIYGVNSMPPQSTGGISVDANGVYGVNASPQPNQSVFGGNNGFDWSKVTPMPNGNSVMDAWGKQGSMFSGISGETNLPQTPQSGGFNSVFSGANANPSIPSISSSNLAQGIGGQNASANDLSKYLGNEYNRAAWIQQDMANNGVTNPLISMLRYDTKIAPLISAAREDDMRNAFMTYNRADSTPEQKMQAIAKLSYYTKQPDLADRIQRLQDDSMYRQGYIRDNSDVGNNILSTFKDYEEGEQWMSPDGTGDSRTQCSNFVSDVLRKVGLDVGSPNGDELMKQFGRAYHTGLDGIQAGDVLNFKDHVGFYVGNGQYIARNSSGGVHQGSMEEAVQAFGQPLGYASVREYASGKPRYTKDMSKENLLRQRHQYNLEEIAARNAYRNRNTNQVGGTGNIRFDKKGNLILDYDNDMRVGTAMDAFKKEFDNPTGKEGKMSANAMMGVVGSLSPIYQYLIRNGLSENDAKLTMRDILNDRLGKDYQGKVGYSMIGDIVDRIALGGGQPQSQQPINGIGGYGTKVNEKKKDGSNHVGFLNISGDGTDSDQFDGNSMDKSQINEIKSQRRWSIYDQAKQNGVISGMDYLGRTVDKYGNIVELDDYGYAKDGLTPEERQYRVARQHREETRGLYQD